MGGLPRKQTTQKRTSKQTQSPATQGRATGGGGAGSASKAARGKRETAVSSLSELGRAIVVELRDDPDGGGRSLMVFKDDHSKSSRRKRETRIYVHALDRADARAFRGGRTEATRTLALRTEHAVREQYANVLFAGGREHRLACSLLEASGVGNAAVALLSPADRVGRVVASFQRQATETVIGLLAVPLGGAAAGITEADVLRAWEGSTLARRTPPGGGGGRGGTRPIKVGHHLGSMLRILAAQVARAKASGALAAVAGGYSVVLIVQLKSEAAKHVKIDCPGGKRHLGESGWACAVREVNEECGFEALAPGVSAPLTPGGVPLDTSMVAFVAVAGGAGGGMP